MPTYAYEAGGAPRLVDPRIVQCGRNQGAAERCRRKMKFEPAQSCESIPTAYPAG